MKTGPELIEEISQYPTLELMLGQNPHTVPYTEEVEMQMIMRERAERALFVIRDEEKRSKRKEKQND